MVVPFVFAALLSKERKNARNPRKSANVIDTANVLEFKQEINAAVSDVAP